MEPTGVKEPYVVTIRFRFMGEVETRIVIYLTVATNKEDASESATYEWTSSFNLLPRYLKSVKATKIPYPTLGQAIELYRRTQ
jgi:hypothetical protein